MRNNDGRAIPNFITQALSDNPLTIYGDGSQTRSFCYISDLVDGIYRLMLSKINTPVNLGNPDEMSISQLARKILELTKSRGKIVYKKLPVDDPKVRRPDISLARKELKWQPEIGLEEGLKRTIDYFKTHER